MSLPIIMALGAGLMGLGTFSVLGLKIGRWLQSKLSPEEVEEINFVLSKFGIASIADIKKLSEEQQEDLLDDLDDIRNGNK